MNFKNRLLRLGLALSLSLVFAVSLPAQTTLGTIRGVATDATGAVVSGVTVVVRNTGTSIENRTTTNERGLYEVPNLNPGVYEVEAETPGFKRVIVSNILLETSTTVRADLQLEVGEVTTSVNVEAASPVINTEGAEVSAVRDHEVLVRLPTNTRGNVGGGFYYQMLTLATPGAQRGQGSNFSFAGARGFQWGTSVDGVTQRSPLFANSVGPAQSNMEITGEIRFQLANDKAESSTPGGFYATTKSGTNELHGALFWYHDNSAFNARDPFSTTVPNTRGYNYGGAIGGPIVRNRTFYFATVENSPSERQRIFNSNLPTTAFKRGDFSSLLPDTVIVDPLTGQPFPGNVIPQERISSVASRVQERFYVDPNFGPADDFRGNWRGVGPGTLYKQQIEGRIDHKISDSSTIFGRLSWIRGGAEVYDYNLITMPIREQDRRTTTLTLSNTHIFSPTVINEFRFGFMRSENPAFNPLDGRALIQEFGLQGVVVTDIGEGAPVFSFNNFETVGSSSIYQDPSESINHLVNNLSWIRGDHTFKTGVEFKWNRATNFPGGTSFPVRQFGDFSFTGAFSGFDYADFLLGLPQTSVRGNPAPLFNMVNTDFSWYLQDDWKVSRRLTLNLGVRYEYNPPYHERDGLFFNFDPASGQVVVPNEQTLAAVNPLFPQDLVPVVTASQAGVPESLWFSDLNNIVPRFGFAYRPFERTVLRGGYGVYVDDITGALWRVGTGGPFVSLETFVNEIENGVPSFQFPNAFPGGFGAIGAQSFDSVDPNFRNPYIQQWNLTLERDVLATGVRVSYIGTSSRKLNWIQNINLPVPSTQPFSNDLRLFPDLRDISVRQNGGIHNYHSLHVVAERKTSKGLFYQLGWTWAKNLTDCQSDSEQGCRPQNPYARHLEYSNVDYTNRHRVVGSFLWELPFGQGRRWGSGSSGLAKWLLGGWAVSGILNAETGLFFDPAFNGFDVSNTNTTGTQLPDRVGDGNFPTSQRERTNWFDTSAFRVPGDLDGDNRPDVNVGRFGNSAPNILEGPGLFALHGGLHKSLQFTERVRAVLQATFTNATNHPNFRNPNGNIRSGNVGLLRQTHQRVGPRSGQVAIRLEF